MTQFKLKRAYEPEASDDGFRVYIDRLWPQGLSHETFHYDLWDKDIAPSTELREWFHADPAGRWTAFKEKYLQELDAMPSMAALAKLLYSKPVVTLLFSSRDVERNNAVVVLEYLEQHE